MSPSIRVRETPSKPSRPRRRETAPTPGGASPPLVGVRRVTVLDALRRDRLALWSLVFVGLLIAACTLAPLLSPYGVGEINLSAERMAPSLAHPLGTDDMGRDQLVRLLHGGRTTLSVATVAVLLAVLIGVLVGAAAGVAGGVADAMIMRATDAVLAVPTFLIVLLVSSLIQPNIVLLGVLIGATQWVETARVVRAVVVSTMQETYIEAARALGIPPTRVLMAHVLPQASGVVLVASTLTFAYSLLVESAMSFLGFGVQPPTPSWGAMLQNAQVELSGAPWLAVFPGVMIFMSVFAFHCLSDFLRRGTDGTPAR